MTKFKAIFLLMLSVTLFMCGCFPSPLTEQHIHVNRDKPTVEETRAVYVSGAVENDGYVTVPARCDYKTLLSAARILPNGYVDGDVNRLLNESEDDYVVDFVENGVKCESINANGYYVLLEMPVNGVEASVISKMASYLNEYGIISNRGDLRQALGDDYQSNYYKFYIDRADYA